MTVTEKRGILDNEVYCNMNSLLTIDELCSAVHGSVVMRHHRHQEVHQGGDADNCITAVFSSVVTDSRCVVQRSMFVPLAGQNQNGHKYIGDAIEKGATVCMVSSSSRDIWQPFLLMAGDKCVFVEVDNTLHALQAAAASYLDKFPYVIRLAITGSNGKTTTKEMIAAILRKKYNVIATAGNLNSETGVPLSVFSLLPSSSCLLPSTIGVFEMGMNREGEIGESAAVVRPQYAVITNIGTAHIGILGSRDAIAREKRKIFDYVDSEGAVFIAHDDDYASFLREGVRGDIIEFGENVAPDVQMTADRGLDGFDMQIGKFTACVSLPGHHNFVNAACSVAVGRRFGVSDSDIATALSKIRPIEGRSSATYAILRNNKKVRIVRDYYNANIDSMDAALNMCDSACVPGKRIYVMGDMRESDGEASHRALGRRVAASKAAIAIFIGTDTRYAYDELVASHCSPSITACFIEGDNDNMVERVSSVIVDVSRDGDLILLKASRGLEAERIEKAITEGNCMTVVAGAESEAKYD